MKKFFKNVILLFTIVTIIVAGVNQVYVKIAGNSSSNVEKFSQMPKQIQICNFGSSHGLNGFNYENYSQEYNCFNFALSSQTLSYDYRLLKYYSRRIGEGTIVFIPISYFSFFGIDEVERDSFESKNKRYYSILPAYLIKKYDLKTAVCVKYFPVLGVEIETLIQTISAQEESDENDEISWDSKASSIDLASNAKSAYKRHFVNNKLDSNGERIVNDEEIEALYDMIKLCKDRGAIPILITTPYLPEYTDKVKNTEGFYEQFYSIINQVVSDTGVEYYDYARDDRLCDNYDLFMNVDHLNREGAKIFVDILMKEIIKEK